MSRSAFFSSRSEKKTIFFDVDIAVKTNRIALNRALDSYRQRVRVITRFPDIFSYCFCMLSEFAKVFDRKV